MTRGHLAVFVVILAALWAALSGHTESLIITFGVLSVIAVTWVSLRMEIVDDEALPLRRLGTRFLPYWSWLAREILRSNLHVARVILSPRMPINPRFVHFKSTQKSDMGVVVFANSITLTPGTVSVEIEDRSILVHALTDTVADPEGAAEMDRRVSAMEAKS